MGDISYINASIILLEVTVDNLASGECLEDIAEYLEDLEDIARKESKPLSREGS